MQRKTRRISIIRYQKDSPRRRLDRVAVEEPLEIRLGWQQKEVDLEHTLTITMRTPGNDFALAAGFLLTEGVVKHPKDIRTITHCLGRRKEEQRYNVVLATLRPGLLFDPDSLQRNFTMTSSCGVCGRSSIEAIQAHDVPALPPETPELEEAVLYQLPSKLLTTQDIFTQTGGLHAAGLFTAAGELLAIHEDVGRHNAVDKLIGQQLLAQQFPLHEYLLLVSGRVSFDIVQKAIYAGIPVILAIGAPSSLAIELAEQFNITLIGFMREQRFNVYVGERRFASLPIP